MSDLLNTIKQSIENKYNKSSHWIDERINENGSLLGAKNLTAYYKLPLALSISNKLKCENSINYIHKKFVKNNWLNDSEFGLDYIEYCPSYRAFWFLMADCNSKKNKNILQNFDKILKNKHNKDVLSMTLSGIIDVSLNQMKKAIKTANWLDTILKNNINSTSIYLRYNNSINPVKSTNTKLNWYIISKKNFNTKIYIIGLLIYFLSNVYIKTRDKRWLNLAERYYTFIEDGKELYLNHHYCGKILLCSSILYKLTKSVQYISNIESATNYILGLQNNDGSFFLKDVFNDKKQQPIDITYDMTNEYIILLKSSSRFL